MAIAVHPEIGVHWYNDTCFQKGSLKKHQSNWVTYLHRGEQVMYHAEGVQRWDEFEECEKELIPELDLEKEAQMEIKHEDVIKIFLPAREAL